MFGFCCWPAFISSGVKPGSQMELGFLRSFVVLGEGVVYFYWFRAVMWYRVFRWFVSSSLLILFHGCIASDFSSVVFRCGFSMVSSSSFMIFPSV
jgi:hypothetical protein